MLSVIVSVALAAAAPSASEITVHSGAELARLAGSTPARGALALDAGEAAVVELAAPLAARSIGFWWTGELGRAEVELLAADGAPLGAWPLVEDRARAPERSERAAERPAGPRRVSTLLHAYAAPVARVRIALVGPSQLDDLVGVWIAGGDAVATGTQDGVLASTSSGYRKPPVYGREAWSAALPSCLPSYCPTTHVAVHHTGSPAEYLSPTFDQCALNVLACQTFQMLTDGTCDIAYNYLICPHGDVFEGALGGDDVVVEHDGQDCGSMAVALMGDFHPPFDQVPNDAVLDSLARLAAWKLDQAGASPGCPAPYGVHGDVPGVFGMREVDPAAESPGDQVVARLDEVRASVAWELGSVHPGPRATPRAGCTHPGPPLSLLPGDGAPSLGQSLVVEVDDPTGAAGLSPTDTFAFLFYSLRPAVGGDPCGTPFPIFGPDGGPGELLIDFAPPYLFHVEGPRPWGGPGQPASFTIPVPCDPSLEFLELFLQASLVDVSEAPERYVATDAVDLVLGR